MEIKRPRAIPKGKVTPQDRQNLDFGRFLSPLPSSEPQAGLPYLQLLAIATRVCGRAIHDIREVRTRREVRRIKKIMEREKKGL
jgi:hypothetical protein